MEEQNSKKITGLKRDNRLFVIRVVRSAALLLLLAVIADRILLGSRFYNPFV